MASYSRIWLTRCQSSLRVPLNAASVYRHVIAKDLQLTKAPAIVIAGDEQPPVVHALAHAMNAALGNVGKTVFYSDPIEANSVDQTQSLRELVGDIDAGRVETLVIIGGNPAYNTPIDLRLDLNRLEGKVKLRAHLSLYNNETSDICHWHINAAHYLESWSDTRTYRRDRHDRAAFDCATLRRQDGARDARAVFGQLRSQAL